MIHIPNKKKLLKEQGVTNIQNLWRPKHLLPVRSFLSYHLQKWPLVKDFPPTHLFSEEEVVYMSALKVPEHNEASTVADEDFVRMLRMLL